MPITTGSELDDAFLCIGTVLAGVLLYKAWKLFAKLFFSAALLYILLHGDSLGMLPSGYLSEKVPNLEGSRVHELVSKSRAIAYVTNAVKKQGVLRYEPPQHVAEAEADVVTDEVVVVEPEEESGGWPWYTRH